MSTRETDRITAAEETLNSTLFVLTSKHQTMTARSQHSMISLSY